MQDTLVKGAIEVINEIGKVGLMVKRRIFSRVLILVVGVGLLILGLGCSMSEGTPIVASGATSIERPGQLVNIVIYTDFQCRNCERLHSEVETELIRRYVDSGLARIEVRVLGSLGPESVLAAEAALSAADQGRFWDYRDAILASWLGVGKAAYSRDELVRVAKELGLDVDVFIRIMESGDKRIEIEENLKLAAAAGIELVPAVLVNGVKIEGRQPLATYIQAIETELQAEKQ